MSLYITIFAGGAIVGAVGLAVAVWFSWGVDPEAAATLRENLGWGEEEE